MSSLEDHTVWGLEKAKSHLTANSYPTATPHDGEDQGHKRHQWRVRLRSFPQFSYGMCDFSLDYVK